MFDAALTMMGARSSRRAAGRRLAPRGSGPRLLRDRGRPADARRVHAGAESPAVGSARPSRLRGARLLGGAVVARRRDARGACASVCASAIARAGWSSSARSACPPSACAASTKRCAIRSSRTAQLLGKADPSRRSCRSPRFASRTTARARAAAPGVGEHTDEILREIGLASEEIAALRRSGVVR